MDRKRILLVDDEPQLTKLLKLNLDDLGIFDVATENDGGRVLEVVARFHPDLIVLDIMMPGIDGGELAGRLRAQQATQHIPIIFLTAVVSRQETQHAMGSLSGLPCLAKPVNVDELLQCITHALGTAPEGGENNHGTA